MASVALSKDEVEERLKSVTDYVRDCERRVSKGEIMDLQGLDNSVVEICDGIAALPPEEGHSLESRMSALIADLEKLAASMREQHEKFTGDDGGEEE